MCYLKLIILVVCVWRGVLHNHAKLIASFDCLTERSSVFFLHLKEEFLEDWLLKKGNKCVYTCTGVCVCTHARAHTFVHVFVREREKESKRLSGALYFLLQTFAVFCMLYVFFWVISRHQNFMCWRFGTVCLFHLHRQVGK
jgi:hypothetical protein